MPKSDPIALSRDLARDLDRQERSDRLVRDALSRGRGRRDRPAVGSRRAEPAAGRMVRQAQYLGRRPAGRGRRLRQRPRRRVHRYHGFCDDGLRGVGDGGERGKKALARLAGGLRQGRSPRPAAGMEPGVFAGLRKPDDPIAPARHQEIGHRRRAVAGRARRNALGHRDGDRRRCARRNRPALAAHESEVKSIAGDGLRLTSLEHFPIEDEPNLGRWRAVFDAR